MASLLYNPDGSLRAQFSGNGTVTSVTIGGGLSSDGGPNPITSTGAISMPNVMSAGTYTLPVCTFDTKGRATSATSTLSSLPVLGEGLIGTGTTPALAAKKLGTVCRITTEGAGAVTGPSNYFYDESHIVVPGDLLTLGGLMYGLQTLDSAFAELETALMAPAGAVSGEVALYLGVLPVGGAFTTLASVVISHTDLSGVYMTTISTPAPVTVPALTNGYGYPAIRLNNTMIDGSDADVALSGVSVPVRIN